MKNNVQKKLDLLAKRILNSHHLPQAKNSWVGADVRIISNPKEIPDESGYYGYKRPLITIYNLEVSWLFERLRNTFYDYGYVSGGNKYEFFGRLANAAIRYIHESPEDLSAHDLLLAVLRESYEILQELESGKFEYLTITFNKVISDDFTKDEERKGFTTIVEMNQFFINRNLRLHIN